MVKICWFTSQLPSEAVWVPQRVFCHTCGATLYDGLELESPTEIIQRYNGICPKCQKRLSFEPETVKIIPHDENKT